METREFDTHFTFITKVGTHGRDKEGAIKNIMEIINEGMVQYASEAMSCGVDYEKEDFDSIETEEIHNGWFELKLLWSGYWSIEADDESSARKAAEEILDKALTPFYRLLELQADKIKRFGFYGLESEQITDVVEI